MAGDSRNESSGRRAGVTTIYVASAFLATTLVVIALLVLQWLSFGNVEETAGLVTRTLQAERELNAFGARMRDAETGQRGFLLTGFAEYLIPYREAMRDAPIGIARLKRMLADNPEQLRRVSILDTLTNAKLAELRNTVKLANEGNSDSALQVVRTNVGDSLMQSIRAVLAGAIRTEDSLVTANEIQLRTEFFRRNAISAGLSIVLGLLLAIVVLVLRRLRRYQDLVTLCAWSKAVRYNGEWLSFEEYLRRRFGLSATHGISPDALAQMESRINDEQ